MIPDDALAAAFSEPGSDPPSLPKARRRLARRPLRWPLPAAAALLLAGLALWRMPKGEAPVVSNPDVVDASWVAPGLRVSGAATRVTASRWRLESGEVRIEDRLGGLEIETPAATLKGLGPWAGRVRLGEAGKLSWIAEARADSGDLLVEVDEGRVEVRYPGETVVLSSGERLRGRAKESFVPPPPQRKVWKPGVLGSGSFPLDLPDVPAYSVEIRARALSPDARIGLAAPVAGALRLWQPSGEPRSMVLAVLGRSASGSVEGSRLWSLEDAGKDLQPASGTPGLRVWGKVEVLEVVLHAP